MAITVSQAFAGEPARQTVEWYRTHRQERETLLRACQNDRSENKAADCWNANSAAHAALADSFATTGQPDREADPAYYEHDAGAISMMLSMCANGGVPDTWCTAARTASTKLRR